MTYNVSDTAGNPATQVTRAVIVSDTTAPVITLLGATPFELLVGDTFTDPGATATDNVDGNISSIVVASMVNTALVGSYTVTYNISDAAGNAATQLTRTVIVSELDTTAPIITLLGANPLSLKVGDTFTDPGVNVLDNIDGNITGNIVIAGDAVNTAIAGTYTVTYNVSDAAGNPATQETRTVIVDGTSPVITLLGVNPLNLAIGDTFIELGATASDDIDGDISGSIAIAGDTVNTAIAGIYVVTYDVSDAAGNPATQLMRTVNVTNTLPVISSFTVNPDPAFTDSVATFSWTVNDANGDILTCLLDVDDNGVTDFTINDCANSTSQSHTFAVAGDFTARLTVSDGIAIPVENTLNLTVLSPVSTPTQSFSLAKLQSTAVGTIFTSQFISSNSDGTNFTGTVSLFNRPQEMLDGILVTPRVIEYDYDGLSFIVTATEFVDSSNNLIFLSILNGVQTCTPVSPDTIPATVKIGDSAILSTLVCNDNTTEIRDWSAEDATNGNINIVTNGTTKDQFNTTTAITNITFTLDASGNIIKFKTEALIPSFDFTTTLNTI